MAHILVVDDEVEITELVALYLQNAGHSVRQHFNASGALLEDLNTVDLAVLDIMLPDMDGFTLCRSLRDAGHAFPIIMLTARDGDQDKINGLVLGADDYMAKPFNPLELVARINAQLRRASRYALPTSEEGLIDINGLVIHPDAHTCVLYGRRIDLTPTEFSILLLLARNRGRVMSSEQIFESVWGEKYLDSNNTVMVHMQKMRKKLGDTGKNKKFIQTVWGVGYKIER